MTRPRLQRRPLPDESIDLVWPSHVPQVLQRIYAARGIRDPQAIDHRLAHLASPRQLGGMEQATTRLLQAMDADQRVLVVGDYDCDGATGTAVAVRGLRLLGMRHVGFVVPHRMRHGYGLSPALVASLESSPDLIVTVDNGIASVDGVAAARERGIDVIVTDHHLPGSELPRALAIVNPNLAGDGFPSKALAGVGVMFYLLMALRARMREAGRFDAQNQPDLSVLLDLVALGTVADLVPLDYNNRILVEAGLRRIRAGKASPGIVALTQASNRAQSTLSTADVGFALAPRLNAAGRLEDMSQGIACLLSDDADEALALATRLSAINAERRQLQEDMVAEAEHLATGVSQVDTLGVALYEPHWHAGVVGLVASKIKDRLYRPVVAFAPAGEGDDGLLRGSARSIPGFHVRDALADVHACHPGLIERFGGHAMAAGLSLATRHFADFARAFDAVARERLGSRSLQPVLWSDGELAAGECCLELAQALRHAGPWGQGFEAPFFDNVFECINVRPMGVGHRRLKLRDPRDGAVLDAVMFQVSDDQTFPPLLRAGYELSVNEWQGRQSARLILRHVEVA
ncbi:MAG TPA: single-stranded-DNA-specific exonuclease RecJ [Rhodanobacteraceae bacterium]|nr:single-stranded-DNA-specific exonuclease RecJ [Rhodanobacteraceae bacterium]